MAAVDVTLPVHMRGWASKVDFFRPLRNDGLSNRVAICEYSDITMPSTPKDDSLSSDGLDMSFSDKYMSSEEDLSSLEHEQGTDEDSSVYNSKEDFDIELSLESKLSCCMAVVVSIISSGPPKVVDIGSRHLSKQTPPPSLSRSTSPATPLASSRARRPSLRLSMLSLITSSAPARPESIRRSSTFQPVKSSRQSISAQSSAPSSPKSRFSFRRDSPSASSPDTPSSSPATSATASRDKFRSLSRSFVAKLALTPSVMKGEMKREMESLGSPNSYTDTSSRALYRAASNSDAVQPPRPTTIKRYRKDSFNDDKMLRRRGILGMSLDLSGGP